MMPTGEIKEIRDILAQDKAVLRLLTIVNIVTTIGAAFFIAAGIFTYVFGNSHAAIRLDIVGIVFFIFKGLAVGGLSYVGNTILKRAHEAYEARQKQTK
jgi:hypothetical protein